MSFLQALEKVAFQVERKLKAQRMAEEYQHLRDAASHANAKNLAHNSHQTANVCTLLPWLPSSLPSRSCRQKLARNSPLDSSSVHPHSLASFIA